MLLHELTLPETASSLEISWTLVALLGTAVGVALLAHIWVSYRAVVAWIGVGLAVRWGPRHKFVVAFLVGVGLLVLVWLGFVALGANALVNPPPLTPDREAASERGGWILVGLESLLFLFQAVLLTAWVAVGRPTLRDSQEPMTVLGLLLQSIGIGRELGHLIRNRLTVPVGLIDVTLETAVLTEMQRRDLIEARESLLAIGIEADALHQRIRGMEPKP
jgi:hypothetical protein